MASSLLLTKTKKTQGDTLHIKRKQINYRGRVRSEKRVTGHINVFKLIDKDTKQFILYAPGLDLSSYGETIEKAEEMFKVSLDNYFNFLTSLSPSRLMDELRVLGWRRDPFRSKDFNHPVVDIKPYLESLNAEKDNVERLSLVA